MAAMSGTKEASRYRFSLSGPRFQLAYVAAVGTGMGSIPFLDWLRARAGLVPLRDAAAVSIFLSALFLFGFLTMAYLGAWRFTRRRFAGDPDLPESGRLLLLMYASTMPGLLLCALLLTAIGHGTGYYGDSFLVYYVGWGVVSALLPVPFAVRDPRHGFFCASFGSLGGLGALFMMDDGGGVGLYVIGAAMAIVFLYFTSGIWVQRIMAIVLSVLVNCSPGLLGATVGTISWAIRRKRAKRSEVAAALEAEPGIRPRTEGEGASTDESDGTVGEGAERAEG
jgi:hypothetical protein